MKFTDRWLRALKLEQGERQSYSDDAESGLMVRASVNPGDKMAMEAV